MLRHFSRTLGMTIITALLPLSTAAGSPSAFSGPDAVSTSAAEAHAFETAAETQFGEFISFQEKEHSQIYIDLTNQLRKFTPCQVATFMVRVYEAIRADWDNLDTASGIGVRDSLVGITDLQVRAIECLENPGLCSSDLIAGLILLLEQPGVFTAIDTLTFGGNPDGILGVTDIDDFIKGLKALRDKECAVNPAVKAPARRID